MEINVPTTTTMIFGLNYYKFNIKYIIDKYKLFKNHTVYWYYAGVNTNEYYDFNPKDIDITNMIWMANTVSVYALIIAIYTGFNEIYLVDIDHNQIFVSDKENIRFYKKAEFQNSENINLSCLTNDLMEAYKSFKQKSILSRIVKNSKILNCSTESLLDMFIKIKLKDVINDKKHQK